MPAHALGQQPAGFLGIGLAAGSTYPANALVARAVTIQRFGQNLPGTLYSPP